MTLAESLVGYSHEMRERLGAAMLKAHAFCESYDRLRLSCRSATKAMRRPNCFLRPSRGMRRHIRRQKEANRAR